MYELVINFYIEYIQLNCHTFAQKQIVKYHEKVKKKIDLILSNINSLNLVIDESDDQSKLCITKLSINMLSQENFYLQNWDNANICQTTIYYF